LPRAVVYLASAQVKQHVTVNQVIGKYVIRYYGKAVL
jgi:hypothetical protein